MDCSQVAQQFGGGGHKAAAGAFLEGSLADVKERVLPVVIERLKDALDLA